MKQIILFLLIFSALFADNIDNNSSIQIEDEVVQKSVDKNETTHKEKLPTIEDSSGLSDEEIRGVAKKVDLVEDNKVPIKEVFEATDSNGTVDMTKIQLPWSELSPTPKAYDWIQTTSGEWFKGEIKSLYKKNLEFESDEVGDYTFKFKDVAQIKSYHILQVSIEDVASFVGIVRLKDNKISIIQGNNKYDFEKNQVISFAKAGDREVDLWSGKVSLSLDIRSGNKNQLDYSAKVNIYRLTDKTRLSLAYLGRLSMRDQENTADDHRINEQYDVYINKKMFWTPVFSELYMDSFQNISSQLTAGTGLGYTFIDDGVIEWDLSGGPAVVRTEYLSVLEAQEKIVTSASLELSTKLAIELNKMSDFTYDYKLTYSDNDSGRYKHHMVLTLENELTKWLDIDITGVWDYILEPKADSNGVVPVKDDYQLLFGFGIEF